MEWGKKGKENLTRTSMGQERSRRILVVDDNRDIRNVLSHMLRFMGFDVALAGNGNEALAAFIETYYRLFLRKDERRGDLTEHILEVNLSTSRFRWGILYSRYYFSYIDETQKYLQKTGADDFFDQENVLQRTSQTYTNSLILGVRGRVPGRTMGRAYWNIETEYFQSDTSG